ncbi:MAG: 50S ribosomal protein L17 [Bacteroidota bacterium]|jgi:large subunit ribosomal protein L17|nr:50S ribosomal protein L17 [Bacteroidota bacterium]
MRHGDKTNNLSRTASHRRALLSNLACQLFQYKKIVTTLAKAKALRPYVEPLITKSKTNTTHQRRLVFSYLQDKEAVKELFDVISPKIASRPGGYTRVIKLGKRVGDNAEIAMIELVDYNEIYGKGIGETETGVKKTRRAGRSKKAADAKAEETTETKAVTAPVEKAKAKKQDDLTKIEGVGPKVSEALQEAGITTFAKIAKSTPEELKEILEKSGGNFNAQDPTSWPEQAQLAADEKWDELKELQDKLIAGR